MDIESFVSSFCTKLPWSVISQILKKNHFPVGQGADKTIEKLLKFYTEGRLSKTLINQMQSSYMNYLRFGDKTISIETIHPSDLGAVLQSVKNALVDIPHNDIKFPYYDKSTDDKLTDDPVFVKQEEVGNYIHLYFASVRTITETISIDDSFFALNNSSFTLPAGIFDASAKQRVNRRYYDVVTIDKNEGHIFYKLDINNSYISPEVTTIKAKLVRKFRSLINSHTNLTQHNLFPAVRKIYNTSKGRVCELGYQVSAVTHGEKMRSKEKDLRKERFHQGGKQVVPSVDVFRIANRYQTTDPIIRIESEVLLPGQTKMLNSGQTPFLKYAILTKCLNDSDFQKHINDLI